MRYWNVEVELALEGVTTVEGFEGAADELVGLLEEYAGAVAVRENRCSIRVSVSAQDLADAIPAALATVSCAAEKAHLAPATPIGVSAQISGEEEEQTSSNVPVLLGVAELASRLGVTRQRASELARSDSFPAPVAVLASGPVWLEPTVLRFLNEWKRRPGRPRS